MGGLSRMCWARSHCPAEMWAGWTQNLLSGTESVAVEEREGRGRCLVATRQLGTKNYIEVEATSFPARELVI